MHQSGVNIQNYIQSEPVEPVKLILQCWGCLKGELRYTGFKQETPQGMLFQHKCECGQEIAITGKTFPSIDFKPMVLSDLAMPNPPEEKSIDEKEQQVLAKIDGEALGSGTGREGG